MRTPARLLGPLAGMGLMLFGPGAPAAPPQGPPAGPGHETADAAATCERLARADYPEAKLLLARGADPHCRLPNQDDSGDWWRSGFRPATPLEWVVWSNRWTVLALFAQRGADLSQQTVYGRTALMISARFSGANGHTMANRLIKHGAPVNTRDSGGRTALHFAALGASPTDMQSLLSAGATVNVRAANGRTPLMDASASNRDSADFCVPMLLRAGANVNERSKAGETALSLAVRLGWEGPVEQLLSAGADANSSDATGRPVLAVALRHGRAKSAWILLRHGAVPNSRGAYGSSILALAFRGHGRFLVPRLLERGANVNAPSPEFPLAHAAIGSPSRLPLLVRAGMRLEEQDRSGRTALQTAIASKDFESARILILAGASLNPDGTRSDPPLHLAAAHGSAAFVKLLVLRGANLEARGHSNRTALMVAAERGSMAALRLLAAAGAERGAVDSTGRDALWYARHCVAKATCAARVRLISGSK